MEYLVLDAAHADQWSRAVYDLLSAEYPGSELYSEWRAGVWTRHLSRADFRLVLALHGRREVAGLVWSYTGEVGQWWSDEVGAALPAADARVWVGGHLEVVELLVAPDRRGRGIGRELVARILDEAPNHRALLSVAADNPARDFYVALGWKDLGKWRSSRVLGRVLDGSGA